MKKYFLGLLVGFVSFIGFSYGDGVVSRQSVNLYNGNSPKDFQCDGYCCIFMTDSSSSYRSNAHFTYSGNDIYFNTFGVNDYYCMQYSGVVSSIMNTSSTAHIMFYNVGTVFSDTSCPTCPTCPVCPECETCPTCPVYNLSLAPLDGNTENYAITGNVNVVVNSGIDYELDNHNNALWLSVGLNTEIGGQCTGDVIDPGSGNWSALYINGIQHESASLIDINIADYVPWDYSINEDVFDLDVGSGYDQDYIDGVIDVQSYRPTSEDFTQTFVGGLILFTPYVVILLFVILVWNLIKKIFKTK